MVCGLPLSECLNHRRLLPLAYHGGYPVCCQGGRPDIPYAQHLTGLPEVPPQWGVHGGHSLCDSIWPFWIYLNVYWTLARATTGLLMMQRSRLAWGASSTWMIHWAAPRPSKNTCSYSDGSSSPTEIMACWSSWRKRSSSGSLWIFWVWISWRKGCYLRRREPRRSWSGFAWGGPRTWQRSLGLCSIMHNSCQPSQSSEFPWTRSSQRRSWSGQRRWRRASSRSRRHSRKCLDIWCWTRKPWHTLAWCCRWTSPKHTMES